MSNLVKVALGLTGIGTVGGGIGYVIYALNKTEEKKISLNMKLRSEGFDTNVTDSEWTAIESVHNSSANKFNIPARVTDKKTWLKNHCQELLEKEDTSNYSKAIQWCVKKQKIVDILKKNNKFRTLNLAGTVEESEKTLWKDKITKLNLPENNTTKTTLSLKLNDNTDDQKIKEIQKKCQEITDTETIGKEFLNNFKLAKDWCSIAKEG